MKLSFRVHLVNFIKLLHQITQAKLKGQNWKINQAALWDDRPEIKYPILNLSEKKSQKVHIIKWKAYPRWLSPLYCPMRNSDQMTIGNAPYFITFYPFNSKFSSNKSHCNLCLYRGSRRWADIWKRADLLWCQHFRWKWWMVQGDNVSSKPNSIKSRDPRTSLIPDQDLLKFRVCLINRSF